MTKARIAAIAPPAPIFRRSSVSPVEPSGAAGPALQARASTGIVGLDEILGGGLPTNHLYLIDGEPGTGKTTLALQFLLAGADRGERGLYVTLSESRAELVQVAESHGWTLETVDVFELSAEESGASDEGYTIFHPAEIELQQTLRDLLDYWRARGTGAP